MKLSGFLIDFENIGKHILAGIEEAAPLVLKFAPAVDMIPMVGPALVEVAQVVTALEKNGATLTSDELQQIIQTISASAHYKTSALQTKMTIVSAPAIVKS